MVKIDTKAEFVVYQLEETDISEKMADELQTELQKIKEHKPGNTILKIPENQDLNFSDSYLNTIKEIQSNFLEKGISFVLTPIISKNHKRDMQNKDINYTPSLAEAIDIIMMEKLERELLDPDIE